MITPRYIGTHLFAFDLVSLWCLEDLGEVISNLGGVIDSEGVLLEDALSDFSCLLSNVLLEIADI